MDIRCIGMHLPTNTILFFEQQLVSQKEREMDTLPHDEMGTTFAGASLSAAFAFDSSISISARPQLQFLHAFGFVSHDSLAIESSDKLTYTSHNSEKSTFERFRIGSFQILFIQQCIFVNQIVIV